MLENQPKLFYEHYSPWPEKRKPIELQIPTLSRTPSQTRIPNCVLNGVDAR
jgi:hypothetical protein